MNDFKRIDNDDEEHIYITHLLNLKNPVLAIGNKNKIRKIASFDSEEYAEEFCELLKKWFYIS